MDAARKRGRPEAALNGNGGVAGSKRLKETDAQHGLGSKSKPCTKFFSTAGCPFGEGCHFLHYVPGGINAVSQMTNLANTALAPPRNLMAARGIPDGLPSPGVKTRMCNKYNTVEGCKFGIKCHFAHGERELGRPIVPSHDEHPMPAPMPQSRVLNRLEHAPTDLGAAASFGVSSTAKISVDASLAGAIIGKGGVNTKHICHVTGVKLAIREHESDPNLKNIELEGPFDQIKHATAMVRELIGNISATNPLPIKQPVRPGVTGGTGSNYKTKLCENFTKGSCTFGDRCHFAHGAAELRKPAA